MKTISYIFNQLKTKYDLSLVADPQKVLFIDIETTGLSPKTSTIYLIGACYYKEQEWHGIQWFAETPEEEELLLHSFFDFAKDFLAASIVLDIQALNAVTIVNIKLPIGANDFAKFITTLTIPPKI